MTIGIVVVVEVVLVLAVDKNILLLVSWESSVLIVMEK